MSQLSSIQCSIEPQPCTVDLPGIRTLLSGSAMCAGCPLDRGKLPSALAESRAYRLLGFGNASACTRFCRICIPVHFCRRSRIQSPFTSLGPASRWLASVPLMVVLVGRQPAISQVLHKPATKALPRQRETNCAQPSSRPSGTRCAHRIVSHHLCWRGMPSPPQARVVVPARTRLIDRPHPSPVIPVQVSWCRRPPSSVLDARRRARDGTMCARSLVLQCTG